MFLDFSNALNTFSRQGARLVRCNKSPLLAGEIHSGKQQGMLWFSSLSNCGFLQVLFFPRSFSPFILPIFSLNHRLPFADDVFIGHYNWDFQGIFIISYALQYVSEWSKKNGLNLNPKQLAQYMYTLTGNAVTNPDLKASMNRNSLSTVESVTYLGDTFTINANRANYYEGIFRKRVRLSIFANKLGRLSTPAECISKFSEACATPINL